MQIPTFENDSDRLFVPEVLMPEQIVTGACAKVSSQPERRLMRAVIEDAIFAYQRLSLRRDEADRDDLEELARWIECRDSTWLFSFEHICETLGLDADAVREALARKPAKWCRGRMPQKSRRLAGARHALRAHG